VPCRRLKSAFGLPVGTRTTLSIDIAIAAVALGAEVIETAFYAGSLARGPDHAASSNRSSFSRWWRPSAMLSGAGTGIKSPAPCELLNISVPARA